MGHPWPFSVSKAGGSMRDKYKISTVQNNFALIVADEYNDATWTITAFDKEGKLVADKLPGAEERIITQNE
ncbi:MAG: hypothetical protein H0Z35_03195 [Thermoanaerobacteraceae bacterium]|nr:hypothetical protein [Thermoanaerobacteraceae bacterium]